MKKTFSCSSYALVFSLSILCFFVAPSMAQTHKQAIQARIGAGSTPVPGKASTGTASLISDGLWLTARHVVEGCKAVYLNSQYATALTNRRTKNIVKSPYIQAQVLGIDKTSDTALLKTEREFSNKRIQPVALGHHNRGPKKGDAGFAMGYPQGEHGEIALTYMRRVYAEQAFASGTIRYEMDLWQVEKANIASNVYQGISGGPTINHQGAIVGINAAGRNPKDRAKGLLYTVPVDAIHSFVKKKKVRGLQRSPNKYINQLSYKSISRNMRKDQQVVRVHCNY